MQRGRSLSPLGLLSTCADELVDSSDEVEVLSLRKRRWYGELVDSNARRCTQAMPDPWQWMGVLCRMDQPTGNSAKN